MFDIVLNNEYFKVEFKHKRNETNRVTDCEIVAFPVPDEEKAPTDVTISMGVGTAVCSENDNFRYNTGRKLALSRAMDKLGLTKYAREAIWNKYFEVRGKKD